ncbi:addiction module antidote protein [Massilia aquatica]|nr:addiction module antidote protein [Massilia aquatica]
MKTAQVGTSVQDEFDMDAINALPRFDVADQLDADEEITAYLNVYLEEKDIAMFVRGLGTVARARAKTSVGLIPSVERGALYKSLREEGAPGFDSVMRVMKSLGLRLIVEPVGTASDPAPPSETPETP